MVKKIWIFIFLNFLFLNLVSAVNDFSYVLDKAAYQIQPIAQFFLGGYDYTGYMLFERFLLFLIVFGITFIVLKTQPLFENQKNVLVVISLAVPLLAIRYINFEWLNTVLLTYGVLGVALTSFLPFIIYFFFLMGIAPNSPAMRKIGWILFICIYFGLYVTVDETFYGEVYMWTAALAFVFLLLDGTINRIMIKNRMKELGDIDRQTFERELRRQIHQVDQDLTNNIVSPKQHAQIKKRLQKQLDSLYKN